jgi:predicted DNA-binding protein
MQPSPPPEAKENSLMSKLQTPDKEATVRFTVDMSESLHRKLSLLTAQTGRNKVDIVQVLLEEELSNVKE